jgi:hypothetical protein
MVEARLQGKGSNVYLFEELQGNPNGLPKRFTRFRNAIFPDLQNAEGQAEQTLHSLRKFWRWREHGNALPQISRRA